MHRLLSGRNYDCISGSVFELGNPHLSLWARDIKSLQSVQQMVKVLIATPLVPISLPLPGPPDCSPCHLLLTQLYTTPPAPQIPHYLDSTCCLAVRNISRTLLLGQKSFPGSCTGLQVILRCWDTLLQSQKKVTSLPLKVETALLGNLEQRFPGRRGERVRWYSLDPLTKQR